jgi:hypothetical protein
MTKCASCGKEIIGTTHIDCRMQDTCDECWNNKDIIFNTTEAYPTGSHWSWNTKLLGKPIVTVDYDHTITNLCGACKPDGDKLAKPQPDVVESISELSDRFKIVLLTGRRAIEQKYEIADNLKKWDIPFDDIILNKPQACFMIDDRAIHHTSWKVTMDTIRNRLRW